VTLQSPAGPIYAELVRKKSAHRCSRRRRARVGGFLAVLAVLVSLAVASTVARELCGRCAARHVCYIVRAMIDPTSPRPSLFTKLGEALLDTLVDDVPDRVYELVVKARGFFAPRPARARKQPAENADDANHGA
jgi:hypothetical protein